MPSNSKLLKMARSRDDFELTLRVAAALTVHAQFIKGHDLDNEQRSFVDWILANPMVEVKRALSFVVASVTVADKITMNGGAINSDAVTDDDILEVIGENFPAIASSFARHGAS